MENLLKLPADFSAEMGVRFKREWHAIFKMLKGKKLQPRIPSQIIIQNRREKAFSIPNGGKRRYKFILTKQALQEILKGIL